jgi:hypothetical protein
MDSNLNPPFTKGMNMLLLRIKLLEMGFTNGNLLEMGGIFYVFNKMYQSIYFECGKNKIFLRAQTPLLIYFFTGLCREKEDFNNQQNFSSQ